MDHSPPGPRTTDAAIIDPAITDPAITDAADARALRIGRFAGWLFGTAGALSVLWTLGTGGPWDGWYVAFLVVCAGGLVVPFFDLWDGRGELLSQLMVATACVTMAVLAPFFVRSPVFLLLPALAAAYAGASVDRRWLAGLVPIAVALGFFRADELGVLAGWTTAATYLGLWLTIGSVAVWMRARVEEGNRELLDAQAAAAERARREAERRADQTAEVERRLRHRIEVATSLRDLVESVRSASDRVEAQSANIATAVDQLAGGLTETSSTSEAANLIVRRIAIATAESQEIIGQLDAAGRQIVGIVDTIADLSEQTNLLALNASIESARAGESGKGFAVVANEVKALASLTAKSASGIGDVIDQVDRRLNESSRAMGAVADLVGELEESQSILGQSVTEQTAVVGDIANAATTGAEGMAEIGRAIRLLDDQAERLDEDSGAMSSIPG